MWSHLSIFYRLFLKWICEVPHHIKSGQLYWSGTREISTMYTAPLTAKTRGYMTCVRTVLAKAAQKRSRIHHKNLTISSSLGDAARFLMSEHTTCGQEITQSPNPPPGWTTIIPTVLATSRGGRRDSLHSAAALEGTKRLTLRKDWMTAVVLCCQPTWPGVSSAAPASACSSRAAGAPECGSPSPWPLGCPALGKDEKGLQPRQQDCKLVSIWTWSLPKKEMWIRRIFMR